MGFGRIGTGKTKVIFILGATGTGKSKLAIDLASRFSGEIINSDKIQVYDALPIITNRVTEAELSAAPHHLLAFKPPLSEFSQKDFANAALESISAIVSRNNLPIVAGGSLSFLEALLEDPKFRENHEPWFIWLDVNFRVLDQFVSVRVDKMVQQGLVEEAKSVFELENSDYSVGVRRAIGVPELDGYFRAELAGNTIKEELESLLKMALDDVKANTCDLTRKQVEKIKQLDDKGGYNIFRIDPTEFFMKKLEGSLSSEQEEEIWEQVVHVPAAKMANVFLACKNGDNENDIDNVAKVSKNMENIWLGRENDVDDDNDTVGDNIVGETIEGNNGACVTDYLGWVIGKNEKNYGIEK